MRRFTMTLTFLSWLLFAFTASSDAQAKRVALVIGNATYQVGPLANPVNDAEAVASALRGLGFDKVSTVLNATKASMERALATLADDATGSDVAVVYFAGHGTEREGRNYLIPVDARLARASDLDLQAISLTTVLDQVAGAAKLKLVILDACRNNIFPLAGSKRSTPRGLARVEPEDNSLVVYAAKDGTTADDGTGRRHSPFTAALLKHIAAPGVEIDYMFRLVRDDVMAATNRRQQPHTYGTLGRERLYLASAAPVGQGQSGKPSPATPWPFSEQPKVPGKSDAPVQSDAGRDRSTQFDSDIAPSGDQWSYLIRANVRVRKDPDGRQLHVTFLGGDVKASEWCRSKPTCVDGNAKHKRIQIEISTCYFTSGSVWRSRDWVSVLRDVPISYPNTGPINFSGHAVKIPIPQVDLALSSHWLCMRIENDDRSTVYAHETHPSRKARGCERC